jgi:hypothetical protein
MASDTQRSQVLHRISAALCLGRDVIYVGFTLITAHPLALLALPRIAYQDTLPDGIPFA